MRSARARWFNSAAVSEVVVVVVIITDRRPARVPVGQPRVVGSIEHLFLVAVMDTPVFLVGRKHRRVAMPQPRLVDFSRAARNSRLPSRRYRRFRIDHQLVDSERSVSLDESPLSEAEICASCPPGRVAKRACQNELAVHAGRMCH